MDGAVAAARAALDSPAWAGLAPAERARILWRVGNLIDEHAEELAQLETLDQGRPIGVSRMVSVKVAAEHFVTTRPGSPSSTRRRPRCPFPTCCDTPSGSRSGCARPPTTHSPL
ncbi:aldehyde dehydrogenase family protein [Streptomyces sp. NPDC020794]|uniref:aldehyde dehydrogenase family protein n=1 Tax=unclassified Streptomyces TaxID=2593676 RepID=UPI0036EA21F0